MYIVTYLIDIVALFYLIGLLNGSTALNSYRKKPFMIGIILTTIIILCESVTVFTVNGSLHFRSLHILSNILGFALTPMISLVIVLIFDRRIFKKHKLLLIPTLMNILASVLSPLYGFIFYVDANNLYTRGDYYFIFIFVYIFNIFILVISTLKVGKKYNYPIMRKMVVLTLFTIIGTSIQLIEPLVYSSWHCVTLSLLLYFVLMSEFDCSFDTLTGLYNRSTFDKATKHLGEIESFSIIILDINDFKNINDTYGHDYGDTVIKEVADIIQKSFNKHYTCYRVGGDEFSIISDETDEEKIEYYLKIMTKNLSKMSDNGNPLPTVSYGFSIFRKGENHDFQKTFKEADERTFDFKKNHKAKSECYSGDDSAVLVHET